MDDALFVEELTDVCYECELANLVVMHAADGALTNAMMQQEQEKVSKQKEGQQPQSLFNRLITTCPRGGR